MLLPFPQDLPFEGVALIIDKLRGKDVPLKTVVNAAWNLAGYAAAQTLPDQKIIGDKDISKDEALLVLQEVITKSAISEEGKPIELGVIPWAMVLRICIKILVAAF